MWVARGLLESVVSCAGHIGNAPLSSENGVSGCVWVMQLFRGPRFTFSHGCGVVWTILSRHEATQGVLDVRQRSMFQSN